jgi:hypothetical protein
MVVPHNPGWPIKNLKEDKRLELHQIDLDQ